MSTGEASDDPGAVFREALRRLFRDDPDSALFPAVRDVTHELEAQIVDALGPDGLTVMDKALFQEIVRVIDEEIPP